VDTVALRTLLILDPPEEAYFRDNLARQTAAIVACIEANDTDAAAILKTAFTDGRRFVVKVIDLDEDTLPPTMLNLLAANGWPGNVVRYHAVFDGPDYRFVIMEECACDLYMESGIESPYSEDGLRCIMRGALLGLSFCHDRRLVHCDFKSSNLLCAEGSLEAYYASSIDRETQEKLSANIKLVDLSEAHEFGQLRGDVGTARAPEIWKDVCEHVRRSGRAWTAEEIEDTSEFQSLCPAAPAEDSWALGATLFELADNEDLFDPDMVHEIVAKGDYAALCDYYVERLAGLPEVFRGRGFSEAAIQFAQRLLVIDPCVRSTAHAALKDEWLA